MSTKMEELLIKGIASRKGVPEQEAAAMVEAMKEDMGEENVNKWLSTLAVNADAIATLPKDAQRDVVNLISSQVLAGSGRGRSGSDTEDLAVRIAAVKAAFKDDDGGKMSEDVAAKLAELQDTIREMKDEKLAAEQKAFQDQIVEKLGKLEEKIEAGKATPEEAKDEIEKLAEEAEKLQNKFAKLRAMMGIPEPTAQVPLDVDGMKQHLLQRGYRVEGPKTIEELERQFNTKLDEVRKQAKEDARKESRAEERRFEVLGDIAGSIIETVIPVIGKGGGAKALEATATLLKASATAGT